METIDIHRLTLSKHESPKSMGSRKQKAFTFSPRSKDSNNSFTPPVGEVSFVRDSQIDEVSVNNLFCIDDDSQSIHEDPLTWRGHPSSTMSDCQLVVSTKEDSIPVEECFHVHRAVLAASDRRCQYFFRVFKSVSTRSENLAKVEVELEYKGGLEAMPALLDFVYSGKLNIHTSNAVPLRYLASFFECKSLRNTVNKFIEQNFNKENAVRYIEETYHYQDSPLMRLSIQETAKLFDAIDEHQFSTLDPEMFYEIVVSEDFDPDDEHKLTRTLVQYFNDNPSLLTGRWLHKFTGQITSIRSNEAPAILGFIQRVNPDDPMEDSESWRALTQLCFRCAQAMAPLDWNKDPTDLQREFFINHQWKEDSDSRILITTLAAKLKFAQEQYRFKAGLHETITARKKQIAVYKERIDGLTSSIAESENQIQSKEAKVNAIKFDNRKLEGDVKVFENRVGKLDAKIGGMEGSVRNSKTKLNAQEVAIRSQKAKVSNEKEELENLEKEVGKLTKANVSLYKKIESDKIKYRARLHAQMGVRNDDEGQHIPNDIREPPPSVASSTDSSKKSLSYNDICREVSANLSHQIREKESEVQELKQKIELKNLEIEKSGKIMTHLNARLRFYEIVNDKKPPQGRARSPPSSGASSTRSRKSSPPAYKFPDNE